MKYIFLIFISISLSAQSFDHKVELDEDGFWGAHYDIPRYSTFVILSLAIFEGSESRIGETAYKSLEAGILSQLVTEGLKKVAGRVRPRYTDSPNEWRQNGASFPSGHVSGMTALVTPFILEYQEEYPLMHLLWALPIHQMGGRIKAQAHWQTDLIAGALIGFASGYWSYKREYPVIVSFTKDKYFLGIKHAF